MPEHDGGPAFPVAGQQWDFDTKEYRPIIEPGMSLRDWFAGQVLAQAISAKEVGANVRDLATHAYAVADAMLAQRKP